MRPRARCDDRIVAQLRADGHLCVEHPAHQAEVMPIVVESHRPPAGHHQTVVEQVEGLQQREHLRGHVQHGHHRDQHSVAETIEVEDRKVHLSLSLRPSVKRRYDITN